MADTIKIGNLEIDNLKVGTLSVDALYIGDVKIYPSTPPPTFDGKWLATYSDSHTESADCDSTSAISQNEINITNLVSVEIGDCVTSIGNNAFRNCSGLTSITIPDSVTSIGQGAFRDCGGLTSCTIGSGVTSIGVGAFYLCTGLTSCTIGSGVTSIGTSAFYGCTGLTSIEIPSGVTRIDINAFNGCSSLTSITVNPTTPPTLGSYALSGTNNCPIYVPAESVSTYQSASGWSTYADRIQAIPNS